MTDTNKLEIDPTIPPRAGLMRGARIMPDPEGILESPFMEQGIQMGYVYVYGEEEPAVFDGATWHPVLTDPSAWNSILMQNVIVAQYDKIIAQAKTNSVYEVLATSITSSPAYTAIGGSVTG
jgi:hypothetical protein